MAVKFRWRSNVFREIRTMPGVLSELEARGARIASAAGDGYETSGAGVTGGRGRGRVAVFTATPDAMRDNARNHTLLSALGAGR